MKTDDYLKPANLSGGRLIYYRTSSYMCYCYCYYYYYWIRIWCHIATHLVVVRDNALQIRLRLCHFKSDRDEIWQDCSSTKYTFVELTEYSSWHNFILSRWWPWLHLPQKSAAASTICQL